MENVKNQEQQALEQIRTIIETLRPDSYIASALQSTFNSASLESHISPELQQIRLPNQVVQEWEDSAASQRETLQRQLAEAEARVAALKAKLHDLSVTE